jgi:serine/threonine protein kinase
MVETNKFLIISFDYRHNMIGENILNYTIDKKIGEGGMGVVYKATDTFGNSVALKMLKPAFLTNKEARKRFRQEAENLTLVNHDNIVRLINYVEDERGLFLILEFIDGKPLDEILAQRGLLPYKEAIEIMDQVLIALTFAHSKNMIHRDIKTSNILVLNSPEVKIKIIDFGIAKMLDSDQNLAHTIVQGNLGSPRYMSPEQYKGETIDHRTDIYSAGIVCYELLTGRNPYQDDTNPFELQQKIIFTQLDDPSTSYPFIPRHVDIAVQKAIKKNPNQRFDSCALFSDALTGKTILEDEQIITINTNQNACIIFNDQGIYGDSGTFRFKVGQENRLVIQAEGHITKSENFILEDKDNQTLRTFNLSLIPQKKSILTPVFAGISIILFITSILLFRQKSTIEKELKEVNQDLLWHKQRQQ